MRFSKRQEGDRGRGERRRRARERAREARRRRQEIERRAAELQQAAPKAAGPETKPKAAGPEAKPSRAGKKDRGRRGAKAPTDKKATGRRARPLRQVPGEVARRLSLAKLLAPLALALALLGRGLRYVRIAILRLAALIERLILLLVRWAAPPIAGFVDRLGRLVTPTRAAVAVAAAAGLAAIVAQALDYRAVEIGGAAYADVASLAQAPLAEHRTPWSAHGPLVGLLALIGAVAAIAVLRGAGRRALLAALGAVGAGLLVILALDLTKAGDLGEAAAEYAGAEAVLLEGFYIELCAMLLIGFTALLPSLWKRKVP